MRVRTLPAGRAGFTLVELMIVITIIAVLASLLLGAVNKVREVGRRTTAVAEISQFDTAISKFKQDFGFNPPQFIHFPPVPPATLNADQLVAERLLKSMFRGYDAYATPGPGKPDPRISFRPAGVGGIDDLRGQKLSGAQCLTFFLAGPQLQGFHPTRPVSPDGNSKKPAYIDIAPSRLIDPEKPVAIDSVIMLPIPAYTFSLRDTWGTPYAYFSSGASENYDPAHAWPIPDRAGFNLGAFRTPGTTNKWVNGGRIQIVSAGPDKLFGTAYTFNATTPANSTSTWTPGNGDYADAGVGADDIANFNGGAPLSVSGN